MTAVQKKMEEFIRREQLLEMGDRVVLGVSGGADSVCMMELFAAIREAWQLELLVVHVHHGLRGAEPGSGEETVAGGSRTGCAV